MFRLTNLLRSTGSKHVNTPNTTIRTINDAVTKKEIIEEISKTHDLSLAQSGRILNTVLDTIVESVADGKPVRLSKFGTFESLQVQARTGRNPSTGAPLYIPAKKRIRFKAYTSFKEMANEA